MSDNDFEVGDRVIYRMLDEEATVLAVNGEWAWVSGSSSGSGYLARKRNLDKVAPKWFEVGASYRYEGSSATYTVRDVWEEGGMRHAVGIWRGNNGSVAAWGRTEGSPTDTFDRQEKIS